MTKRLTEHKTTKGITRIVIKPYIEMSESWQPVADKLCAFEDIMEKYGIESFELLEHIIKKGKVINSVIEDFVKDGYDKMKQERDTWKRACELACEDLQFYDYGNEKTEDGIKMKIDYFYQQAKKEKENENDDTDN